MNNELIENINKSLKDITQKSSRKINNVSAIPATKIFLYLEELFKKNPDGFYKFQSPSKVSSYEVGTSMCEETGWEFPALQQRLKKVCTLYKSKTAYLEALENLGKYGVFCGNPYLRYRDHNLYQVYFMRNQRVVSDILNGIPLTRTYQVPVGKLEETDNSFASSV